MQLGTRKDIDAAIFSDFDLAFLLTMKNSGLNISNFNNGDELKCLSLFFRAQFCTQNLDIRPRDKMIDENGKYIPINVPETRK